MELSANAKFIINVLENGGFEAFAVGGCVRDFVMGRACSDVDIATSATPAETERLLGGSGIKFIETGIKHGTITAVYGGEPFEITTYRTDGDYADNRHPDSVCFITDIESDLARRDFTVNAMAYNDSCGIKDPFGGIADIENGLIRAVGDPDKRFNEDALRIMRALRFSSVLGFEIEERTRRAVFDNKDLLSSVSAERLFAELSKLLTGDNVFNVLMNYKEVIAVIIPEIKPLFDCPQNTSWHIYGVWEHTCKAVASCPADLKLRLTMLLHDLGKPYVKTTDENGADHFKGHQQVSGELSGGILKRFKVSNEIYDYVMTLVPIHDIHIPQSKKGVRRQLARLGEYYFKALVEVKRADKRAQNLAKTAAELERLDEVLTEADEIIAANDALGVKDLDFNGSDAIALGFCGKGVGRALDFLLESVIDEKVENEKTALCSFLNSSDLPRGG